MLEIKLNTPLVSAEWLHEHLYAPNVVILDATMPKAGLGEETLSKEYIPRARFMDLKNEWSRKGANFPNTLLDAADFERVARESGVDKDSALVFYDQHGIYSSARGWYMFRAMGHDNVAVLDGGLPAWLEAGYPVGPEHSDSVAMGNFKAELDPNFFKAYPEVYSNLHNNEVRILDARSHDRFLGLSPEPREGLRSGHIPGSVSLPYADLQEQGKMKDRKTLDSLFANSSNAEQSLILSCGSGITACVLALGAELTGRSKYAVYDGSWTEWGSLKQLPVEKK